MNTQVNTTPVATTAMPVATTQLPDSTVSQTVAATVDETQVAPQVHIKRKTAADDFLDDDDEETGGEGLSQDASEQLEKIFGAESGSDAELGDGDSTGNPEDGEVLTLVSEGGNGGVDLSDLEDLDDEDSGAILNVYKKKCLECKALVPWAEKLYKQCHFSNGNENCPAKSVRIQTRIPMERIIPRFLAAEQMNDSGVLMLLHQNLSKKESWVQDAVHEELKKAREARKA
jgi:hypothetical protein